MLTNLELLGISEENLNWLNDNYSKIQEEFASKVVAIKDRKVVASSDNVEELLNILKNNKINEEEVLIESVRSKGEIVILCG